MSIPSPEVINYLLLAGTRSNSPLRELEALTRCAFPTTTEDFFSAEADDAAGTAVVEVVDVDRELVLTEEREVVGPRDPQTQLRTVSSSPLVSSSVKLFDDDDSTVSVVNLLGTPVWDLHSLRLHCWKLHPCSTITVLDRLRLSTVPQSTSGTAAAAVEQEETSASGFGCDYCGSTWWQTDDEAVLRRTTLEYCGYCDDGICALCAQEIQKDVACHVHLPERKRTSVARRLRGNKQDADNGDVMKRKDATLDRKEEEPLSAAKSPSASRLGLTLKIDGDCWATSPTPLLVTGSLPGAGFLPSPAGTVAKTEIVAPFHSPIKKEERSPVHVQPEPSFSSSASIGAAATPPRRTSGPRPKNVKGGPVDSAERKRVKFEGNESNNKRPRSPELVRESTGENRSHRTPRTLPSPSPSLHQGTIEKAPSTSPIASSPLAQTMRWSLSLSTTSAQILTVLQLFDNFAQNAGIYMMTSELTTCLATVVVSKQPSTVQQSWEILFPSRLRAEEFRYALKRAQPNEGISFDDMEVRPLV